MEQQEIIDLLSNMTVKQLADLAKALEDEWGVTAAAAVAVAAAPGVAAAGGAAEEEQTEFNVMLTDFGANKINVIKAIRGITGLGLKEAKELVEGAPSAVKEGVSKEEAESIKKELEEAGAKVELK